MMPAVKPEAVVLALADMQREGECGKCGEIYTDRTVEVCPLLWPDEAADGGVSECGGAVFWMTPADAADALDQMIGVARQARESTAARAKQQDAMSARDWAVGVLEERLTREDSSRGVVPRAVKAHRRWMQEHIRPALDEIARQ